MYRLGRACVVAISLISSADKFAAQAGEQVVTIRLTPGPLIEAHIRKIQGPERTLRVSIDKPDDSLSKSQNVSVRGPIADSQVSGLVRSAVAGRAGYWTHSSSWTVNIVGDGQYAVVTVSSYCGELCGSGASYTYALKNGSWAFEYTSNQWIS